MNRKRQRILKKIFAYLIIFMMLGSALVRVAFAQDKFSDVKSGFWGKKYIEEMVDKEIFSGYENGTFKPDNKVSRLEALVIISRLFKKEDVEEIYDKNKNLYKDILKKNNIPSWAYKEIVFCLEEEIINEKYLETIIKDSKQSYAFRYEIPILLVRGMDLEDELKEINILSYNDVVKIEKRVIPYVALMGEIGVLNKNGDYKGNFNPNTNVSRAEMAKMIYVSYHYMEDKNINIEDKDKNVEVKSNVKYIDGKIKEIYEVEKVVTLKFETNIGSIKTYYSKSNDLNTKINGEKVSLEYISADLEAKIGIKNDELISIDAKVKDDSVSGYFSSVRFDSKNRYVEMLVDSKKKTYRLDSNSKFYIDGLRKDIYDLKKGDKLKLKLDKNTVKEGIGYSKEKTIDGIISSYDEDEIEIKLENEEEKISFDFNSDVKIYKNGEKADIDDLYKGDEVSLNLEYGEVKKVDSESVIVEQKGVLKELKIALLPETSEITILDSKDDEVTYDINSNFKVEIDKEDKSLYELRIGYEVELEIENDKVIKITSDKEISTITKTGIITDIDTKDNEIELKDMNTSKRFIIKYDSKTDIEELDSSNLDDKDLDEGDEITIIGENSIGNIKALKIIRIKKN